MIGIIFGVFGLLLSPIGVAGILFGFLAFAMLPVLGATTELNAPTNILLWLAKQPLDRAAIVVGEHGDLYFRSMTFNALGLEEISLDGETKMFEDPDSALHLFLGIPFALADERHGVLFDPRHAALGERKHTLRERGEDEFVATEGEWDKRGVTKWKPAVFEMPEVNELVDVTRIRELVDGGERSEYAQRVEELYKNSRAPFDDGTPMTHFFYPIIAFLLVFGGLWFMSSQLGGASAPDSVVGYGASMLLAMPAFSKHSRAIITAALAIAALGLVAAIGVFAGPVMAITVLIGFAIGFGALPLLTLLFSPFGFGRISELWLKAAMLSFRRPVLEWTPRKYRLREYDEMETTDDINWYGLWGSDFGITFEPGEQSWGAELMERDELEAVAEPDAVTDGGVGDSNIPAKYRRTDIQRGNIYGGVIPKRLKRGAYYLNTGIALGRFRHSATGEKALKQLLQAKEKHGESGDGVEDKTVLYMTAGAGLLGLILGVFFFLL